jgi:ABC-type transporter Mla maintaining outer membrane lipid asymmetry ATPase subunit MlaF
MLRFVDLEDAADKMPNELSGGMRRQWVSRERSPAVKDYLCDEPTADSTP